MVDTQLGAFVLAFTELWTKQSETEEALQGMKLRWWNHLFATLAWLAFAGAVHLIVRGDEPAAGWLLLLWPQAWLAMRLNRSYAARLLIREASEIGWQDFRLRFEWRALGLYDSHLSELRRLWVGAGQDLDLDSPEYRRWWQDTIGHLRVAQ